MIPAGISNVKSKRTGIVNKHTEGVGSADQKKIVGAVKGMSVFQMIGIISSIADIEPASFINAPYLFSKSIYRDVIFKRKTVALLT